MTVSLGNDNVDVNTDVQECRMKSDRFVCQTVGVNLLNASIGMAEAELIITPAHLNGEGVCQGGALFTLADFTLATASNYTDEPVLSLDLSISFCRPVTSGKVIAKAKEVNRTRSTTLGQVTVYDEQGRIVCTAFGRGFIVRK